MKTLLTYLTIIFSIFESHSYAQQIPIIKATSKNVKIRDGAVFKENFWVIFPETKPDIYWVDFPKKEHKVTFITDKDSISFDVKYGHYYDFIVLLNEKDSCYTRISGTYPKTITPIRSVPIDSIPFTIIDNRIYVKGKINGSENLTFQFDLGAVGVVLVFINHISIKKVNLNFDKTTTLSNNDGINQVRMSSVNTLILGKSEWQSIEIVETKNMKSYEDVLFGNGLFLDKYIEVDYDKKMLIIHDKMPLIDEMHKKYPIRMSQGVCPEIEATFEIERKKYTEWFGFDTGNTGNGILNYGFLIKYDIYDKFSKIMVLGDRAIARIPQIHFADYTFSEGLIVLERNNEITSLGSGGGVLGNKLLKKFNFILDSQQGFMYLKPNFFFAEQDTELRDISLIAIGGVGVILTMLLYLIRWCKRKYK